VPRFSALAGVIPCNIAINDISLKLDSLAYISAAESIIAVSSTTFTVYVIRPESYRIR